MGGGARLENRLRETAWGFDSPHFRIETQAPVMGRPGVVEQD